MTDKVKNGKVVAFSYELKDSEGKLVEKSETGAPLTYLHGSSNIIPGLEKEMEGMLVGDKKDVLVAPEEGYGEYNAELVFKVPKENFPDDVAIKEGMQFKADSQNGPLMLIVKEVHNDYVIVDGNHPMAGSNLHFAVTIDSIRDATAEEVAHGHAHGAGGHHH